MYGHCGKKNPAIVSVSCAKNVCVTLSVSEQLFSLILH
jgi:hypothetical protein